jgi:hypothetical protein
MPGDPRIGTTNKDVLYRLHLVVAEDAPRVMLQTAMVKSIRHSTTILASYTVFLFTHVTL